MWKIYSKWIFVLPWKFRVLWRDISVAQVIFLLCMCIGWRYSIHLHHITQRKTHGRNVQYVCITRDFCCMVGVFFFFFVFPFRFASNMQLFHCLLYYLFSCLFYIIFFCSCNKWRSACVYEQKKIKMHNMRYLPLTREEICNRKMLKLRKGS